MSIASLGGPLKAEYLTLPRTKVRDAMSFATGGSIPEVAGATDEELMAMVTRGELDPNIANKIIAERAQAGRREKFTSDLAAPFNKAFPSVGPSMTPQQGGVMDAMQRQGGRPMMPPAPPPPPVATEPVFTQDQARTVDAMQRQGGRPIDVSPPSGVPAPYLDVQDPMEPAAYGDVIDPSKPLAFQYGPQIAKKIGSGISSALDWAMTGGNARGRYERDAEQARNQNARGATNDPNSLTPVQPAGTMLPPSDIGAVAGQQYPLPAPDIVQPFDLKSIGGQAYPAGSDVRKANLPPVADDAGLSSLPAPPAGAASSQGGGIAPVDDPNSLTPAFPQSDNIMTGGTGGQGVPPAAVEQVQKMANTPVGQDVIQSTDSMFGNGRGWEAMMMLGLGMAASKNPSFLGAIAEGGIGAVKYMGERRKEDRDDRRLNQQDRRADLSEERANRSFNMQVDQFNFTKEKDARDAPLAAEDKKSQMAYRKAMTDYYNTGGKTAPKNMTATERLTGARQIAKEAEDYATAMTKDMIVTDPDEKVQLYNKLRDEHLRSYGLTREGIGRLFGDAMGTGQLPSVAGPSNPSTNAPVRRYNPATGKFE